jgi:putative oxidoreductase
MAKRRSQVSAYGATLLRIMLGVIYVMHGYHALVVLTPPGAAAFMTNVMGLPFASVGVWYLIGAHLVGGVLLILGLFTRWAALANVPIMVCAVFLFHIKQGFFMTGAIVNGGPRAIGYEFSLLVLVATVAQVLLGGGALAVRGR